MAGSLPTGVQGVGWTLKVLRSDGVNSSEFAIGYTAPVLSSVSPLSGPVVGGTTITVTGSSMGFADAAVLMFGGRVLALSYAPAALGQLTTVCVLNIVCLFVCGCLVDTSAGDGRGAGVGRRDADILSAAEPDDRWRDGADIERAVLVVPVRWCVSSCGRVVVACCVVCSVRCSSCLVAGPSLQDLTVSGAPATLMGTGGGEVLVISGENFASGSQSYDPLSVMIGECVS